MYKISASRSEESSSCYLSNNITSSFRNTGISPKKKKIVCINEEESDNETLRLCFFRKRTSLSNYFNIYFSQLTKWLTESTLSTKAFRDHFFLLSSSKQSLLQVIRI
ncbi:hypothetical protein SAMN05444266_11349 [Chitinophaga jiangningensis]|uniref:Uncharacterized protein n=1 Tax=Chitinophaga jiangningensis TaxID=1419482 RepID=A0A1M7MGA0_9BACT|nr:hypothetical protein [Chitinophaga jiangningensis]SHM89966.1 hypothetical protein SAMN05444266_11349 [Chitinophaga jiangningensis]